MDFIQSLDPSKLVLAGTWLSFILSPFSAPFYNLPIFLFGVYTQENTEAFQSLQTFTALLGGSCIWDIIWMTQNSQHGFIKFLTVLLLILKVPTFFAFGLSLRQRGAQFSGLGIRGSDLIWSMPGGFTSTGRDGYQAMDEERPVETSRPAPRPAPPTTAPTAATPAPPTTNAGPGAYQSL
ncbi:hypothetical protein WG66_015325 [Moniliophthora roreri]|nr:hypothetical protein WG66_015325 [Moniliophthora roreri]